MNSDFKAFVERLKETVRIEEVVAKTGGLTVYRRGKYFTSKEHDSLSIDPERGWFEWYSKGEGAGARGDVIEWLLHWGGYPDFKEAVRFLSEETGLHYEWGEAETQAYAAKRERDDALTVIAGYLAGLLPKHEEAMTYADERGWSTETISRARLGWWDGNRKALVDHLGMHQIEPGLDIVAAVLKMPANMLVYCHMDRGKCVYLQGRTIAGERRMWNLPTKLAGTRQPYWNHVYAHWSDLVVVVEGQADAITLGQWEIPAVALAGSSAGVGLIGQLRKHGKVYVALDADKAGAAAARQLAEALGPATPVVTWPNGGDANDWLQNGGSVKACLDLLAHAPIYALYRAGQWWHVPDLEKDDERRAVYELIASLFPYDYATHAEALAERMRLPNATALNKVIRAVKKERDMAAQGVEEAQRKKETKAPLPKPSANGARPTFDPALEELLISQSRDHEGHAQSVTAMFGERIAFVPEWGWLTYNGAYWQREGSDHQVQEFVVQTLKARRHLATEYELDALVSVTSCKRHNVTSTQSQLERLVIAAAVDFDKDPDLLNCANGVVDLRTGELLEHDPEQRFTYCLPVDYRASADFSDWLLFLGTATGMTDPFGVNHIDTELIDWLQAAVGYSLTGHTSEGCIFYLYGPTRSGKGTFTQTLMRMLGKPLGGSIDFNVLTAQRSEDSQNFALAPLKPCRLLVGNEPGKYERFNEAKLKQLTGEDPVRCSYKNRDQFEYDPQFKIWLSSNWPFNADTSDDAAWGRARVIHFPNSFLGREDKGLKNRLQGHEGLEGVLAWAVAGARQWYEQGERGLQTPAAIEQTTKGQRLDQDYIQQFIDDCCEVDEGEDSFTSIADLYQCYVNWCQGMLTPQKNRSFSLSLKGKGFRDTKTYVSIGPDQPTLFNGEEQVMPVKRKQIRGYLGIALNENGQTLLEEKKGKK